MPLQAYSEFNDFLNLADVHLVIQKASASDLVMPSKLTTILAVGGLAIITANPGFRTLFSGKGTPYRCFGWVLRIPNNLKECILKVVNNDIKAK